MLLMVKAQGKFDLIWTLNIANRSNDGRSDIDRFRYRLYLFRISYREIFIRIGHFVSKAKEAITQSTEALFLPTLHTYKRCNNSRSWMYIRVFSLLINNPLECSYPDIPSQNDLQIMLIVRLNRWALSAFFVF